MTPPSLGVGLTSNIFLTVETIHYFPFEEEYERYYIT